MRSFKGALGVTGGQSCTHPSRGVVNRVLALDARRHGRQLGGGVVGTHRLGECVSEQYPRTPHVLFVARIAGSLQSCPRERDSRRDASLVQGHEPAQVNGIRLGWHACVAVSPVLGDAAVAQMNCRPRCVPDGVAHLEVVAALDRGRITVLEIFVGLRDSARVDKTNGGEVPRPGERHARTGCARDLRRTPCVIETVIAAAVEYLEPRQSYICHSQCLARTSGLEHVFCPGELLTCKIRSLKLPVAATEQEAMAGSLDREACRLEVGDALFE